MGKFSSGAPPRRISLSIEIPEYLMDHTIMGRPVFPATEGMRVLSNFFRTLFPETDLRSLSEVCFDRFLYLPADRRPIEAAAEFTEHPNGAVTAMLTTRTRPKRTAMSRELRHFAFRTAGSDGCGGSAALPRFDVPETDPDMQIDPSHLYRDLVPFGPAFRNVVGSIYLWPAGAVADVSGGPEDFALQRGTIGSSFPLDAAFHAACVWGQRYTGIVAFPVGMNLRTIFMPCRSGEIYTAVVMPVGMDDGILVFDILLYDAFRRPCELISRLRMRDVSGGRLRPPAWVTA